MKVMSGLVISTLATLSMAQPAAAYDQVFDDPTFRRCVQWLMDGQKGGGLQTVCTNEYDLPPPSLFLCARKVRLGFPSAADQEGCAMVFEDHARQARGGYLR